MIIQSPPQYFGKFNYKAQYINVSPGCIFVCFNMYKVWWIAERITRMADSIIENMKQDIIVTSQYIDFQRPLGYPPWSSWIIHILKWCKWGTEQYEDWRFWWNLWNHGAGRRTPHPPAPSPPSNVSVRVVIYIQNSLDFTFPFNRLIARNLSNQLEAYGSYAGIKDTISVQVNAISVQLRLGNIGCSFISFLPLLSYWHGQLWQQQGHNEGQSGTQIYSVRA